MVMGKTAAFIGSALLVAGIVSTASAESYQQKDARNSNAYRAYYTGNAAPAGPYVVQRQATEAPAATNNDGMGPGYVPGRQREY